MVLKKQVHEPDLLLSLGHELTATRDKTRFLQIIEHSLKVYFPFDALLIQVLSADGLSHSVYMSLLEPALKQDPACGSSLMSTFPVDDGIFNLLFATEKPVIIDLDIQWRRKPVVPYVAFLYKHGIRELLGISLRDQQRPFGSIFICTKRKQHFNPRQLGMLQKLCMQVSVAVANIRSYEEIERQLKETERTKTLLEAQNLLLQQQISTVAGNPEIIGSSASLKKVFELLSLVAATESTVLLLGETGTGKELIAKAIHDASPRRGNALIKVNCAALPVNLIESELFGHEKGSFTGATERSIGKFELAQNGTLFLDEIGEMPFELQVKLLRVLQEREFERVGGRNTIRVNVRIIAATNKDLPEEIRLNRFRNDLYYRLNVFPITLPPLRERKEDIPALTSYFLKRLYAKTGKHVVSVSSQVLRQMAGYEWPGNIRELEHLIERSMLMTSGTMLHEIILPSATRNLQTEFPETAVQSLQDHERDYILSVLRKCGGRVRGKGGAAILLQLPPTTLHSKMKKLGIRKTGG